MGNPIIDMMNRSTKGGGQNGMAQLFGLLKASKNPLQLLSQVYTNDEIQQAMTVLKQYNGDGRKALEAVAMQKGADPSEILNLMK